MKPPLKIKQRVAGSLPVKTLAEKAKRLYPPGFGGLSLHKVWRPFITQLRRTSLTERAGGIAFNIVMAIPPTLIFIFTLIPYLPISKVFIDQLFNLVRDIIPGQKNNSVIISFLDDFLHRPRNGFLSLGLLAALFFSSNAMMGVLRTFDKKYPGFLHRTQWQRRKLAIKLTLLNFFLIFICILLLLAQGFILKWIGIESTGFIKLIHTLRWIPLYLLSFLIISIIYRYGVPVPVKWPLITPGAFFATSLLILATGIFSYWVNHFNTYNKLYGSISAIFISMSLIYVIAFSILMGFELNVTLSHLKGRKIAEKNNDNL